MNKTKTKVSKSRGKGFWPSVYQKNLRKDGDYPFLIKKFGNAAKVMKAEKELIWKLLDYHVTCRVIKDEKECKSASETRHQSDEFEGYVYNKRDEFKTCKFIDGSCTAGPIPSRNSLQFLRWLLYMTSPEKFRQYVRAFPHQLTETGYGYDYDEDKKVLSNIFVKELQEMVRGMQAKDVIGGPEQLKAVQKSMQSATKAEQFGIPMSTLLKDQDCDEWDLKYSDVLDSIDKTDQDLSDVTRELTDIVFENKQLKIEIEATKKMLLNLEKSINDKMGRLLQKNVLLQKNLKNMDDTYTFCVNNSTDLREKKSLLLNTNSELRKLEMQIIKKENKIIKKLEKVDSIQSSLDVAKKELKFAIKIRDECKSKLDENKEYYAYQRELFIECYKKKNMMMGGGDDCNESQKKYDSLVLELEKKDEEVLKMQDFLTISTDENERLELELKEVTERMDKFTTIGLQDIDEIMKKNRKLESTIRGLKASHELCLKQNSELYDEIDNLDDIIQQLAAKELIYNEKENQLSYQNEIYNLLKQDIEEENKNLNLVNIEIDKCDTETKLLEIDIKQIDTMIDLCDKK